MEREPKKFVSAEELGRILGVGRQTILNWADAGRIPKITFSPRCIRFDLDAVLKAVEAFSS